MNTVQCVSLPRCGHNLLVFHLQKYFRSNHICVPSGPRNRFFTRKPKPPVDSLERPEPGFHYCEYYYACRQHPCENRLNTFQKSHDFDLKLPVNADRNYIIQFRQPMGLLISWFEMRLIKRREVDSAEGFLAFVERNRNYLEGFCQKWIEAPSDDRFTTDNRLLLDYDDYVADPAKKLASVIGFFLPGADIDQNRIKGIVADVQPAKDDSQFRYYTAASKIEFNLPKVG